MKGLRIAVARAEPANAISESVEVGRRVQAAARGNGRVLRRADPALDLAITQAVVASVALAEKLDKRSAAPTKPRAAALAAVEAVIEHLRTVKPNEDTLALGLGW